MKNLNNILKKITVCLFAIICIGTNMSLVANATELGETAEEATEATEETTTQTTTVAEPVEGSVAAIIEIQDYTIDGGMIEAGKEITVNLTLHNTSSSMAATSVMMTLSNTTGSLYPAYGNDNQIYVGNIGADKTKTVSVPMTIGQTYMGDAVDLICQFDYAAQNARLSNQAMIVIPRSGGSTIGVKSIDVSSHAIVNGKSLLAISYVNQSSANITDARIIVDGNVSNPSKEIKLDTVYAGKSYTEDFYVSFKESGNQQIQVSLAYTDVDGQQNVTDLGTFDVTVSKENVEEDSQSGLKGILSLVGTAVAGVVLLFAAATVFIYIKKR
ncbi:COG1361 family protein [Pseudobutyrivibrio xylanivorans]|uniref:Uncharacterized protein n=1 Tax=Pseudobutyrivibrio xylanivorans DSM 14809 TaxID=1123012 RepID=A0A1M6IGL4_PSEXY|nr:hypothetical protein [Pseudobutyrivibrio xylanivorans]SHJ33577.1 hypothetical protein SAMN02745725_02320 [Pseudobutyrivibrio xylanivorans DSM 14809]